MNKFFSCLITSLFLICPVFANEIDKLIKDFDLNSKAQLGIYIKNADNDKVIYKKHENEFLNPASTLKVLTFGASLYVLGEDFDFETALFEDNKDLYIKLSGDTKLTYQDLKKLLSNLKTKDYDNIYIDNSIFEDEKYPSSWFEEDKFPNQRTISPYIIDNNLIKLSIKRSSLATNIDIVQEDDYKIAIINELKNSQENKQNIEIKRLHGENSPILTLSGEIFKDEIITIPVLNPEINFIVKFQKALKENNIVCLKKINTKKVPPCAKKIASIKRNIKEFAPDILLNSNNFTSEVVSKTASAKFIDYRKSATFQDEIEMFDYVLNFSSSDNKIADSSGVSRKNLITTEFYINSIEKLFEKTTIFNLLATPNEGTMRNRGLFLKDNLKAKTGTLKDYSSIFATFVTKNNNNVILISIEQNSTLRKALLKNFEDMLIGTIYRKF